MHQVVLRNILKQNKEHNEIQNMIKYIVIIISNKYFNKEM